MGIQPVVAGLMAFGMLLTFSASVSAETRSLKLYNTHTKERAAIVFKKNGRYVSSGLRKLNTFLRDWRRNEPTKMDPELFDLVWEVYQTARTSEHIHVVSGYRSLKTNNMLRNRSRGVAKNSQHTKGRAMDFYIPGVKTSKLRAIGLRQHVGGVGYYPRSNSPFVHLDTGSIRHWPRMSRHELAKVFPRGRTIHVPTDGKKMAGYNRIMAEVKRKGSTMSGTSALASSRSNNSRDSGSRTGNTSSNNGGGFFNTLFSNKNSGTKPQTSRESDPGQRVDLTTPTLTVPRAKTAYADVPTQSDFTLPPATTTGLTAKVSTPDTQLPHTAAVNLTPPSKPTTTGTIEALPATTQLAALISTWPRTKPASIPQLAAYQDPSAPPLARNAHEGIAAIDSATTNQPQTSTKPLQTAELTDQAYNPVNEPSSTPKARESSQALGAVSTLQDPLAYFTAKPVASSLVMHSNEDISRNKRLAYLYHPNQNFLEQLVTSVNSVVQNDFSSRPFSGVSSTNFTGAAIEWLETARSGS